MVTVSLSKGTVRDKARPLSLYFWYGDSDPVHVLDVRPTATREHDARWVVPDFLGKGNRVRTITITAGVRARIDLWTSAAGMIESRLFRPVTKAGVVQRSEMRDEKAVWRLSFVTPVKQSSAILLPMICGEPARSSAERQQGTSSRSSSSLAMLCSDDRTVSGNRAGPGSCGQRRLGVGPWLMYVSDFSSLLTSNGVVGNSRNPIPRRLGSRPVKLGVDWPSSSS